VTSPRRARRDGADDTGGPANPLAGATSLRGGVLIAVAVLIGVVLLGKGFDSGFLPSASSDPSDEVATGDDDGGDDGTDDGSTDDTTDDTSSTTPSTHAPAEVRVQALNSTGPQGSAGAATAALSELGYNVVDGANAADRNAPATAIYVAAGYEGDALQIASALGITAAPQAMPVPPPAPAPADALVVVVLGPDFVPPAAGDTTTSTASG
jgi:hypothetical protein